MPWGRHVLLVCAAAAAVLGGAGCGDDSGSSGPRSASRETTVTSAPEPGGTAPRDSGSHAGDAGGRDAGFRLQVPRGFHVAKKPVTRRNWPVPLKVAASFPIRRGSPNASCPRNVLRSFPPDGVYVLVAEFTRRRPPGIPPRGQLPPRGDLSRLDLRPAEVECWNDGPSGAKDFTENGRSYRVEVLLGPRVSAARRRAALDALGRMRLPQ